MFALKSFALNIRLLDVKLYQKWLCPDQQEL